MKNKRDTKRRSQNGNMNGMNSLIPLEEALSQPTQKHKNRLNVTLHIVTLLLM